MEASMSTASSSDQSEKTVLDVPSTMIEQQRSTELASKYNQSSVTEAGLDSRLASTLNSPRNGSIIFLDKVEVTSPPFHTPVSAGSGTPEEAIPFTIYSSRTCHLQLGIAILVGSISGLSSNIFFPAIDDISVGLNAPPKEVLLAITGYIIGQSLAPSFWGPLSDRYGRRSILLMTLGVTVMANVGLALSTNVIMLIFFRILQATGSSSAISIGNAILADLFPPAKRGGMQGVFSALRQSSQAFGPVIGGLLAGNLGWRSIFWALLVVGGVCGLLVALFFPETSRKISGNGANLPRGWLYRPLLYFCMPWANKRYENASAGSAEEAIADRSAAKYLRNANSISWRDFTAPLKMILWPDCACALSMGACCYTAWSMMVAITTYLLKDHYQWTTLQIGLAYFANGSGCMLGAIYNGFLELDTAWASAQEVYNFRRGIPFAEYVAQKEAQSGKESIPADFPLESARLGRWYVHATLMVFGLIMFGWSLEDEDTGYSHWIVPLLAQFMVGFGMSAILSMNQTFVVDLGRGMSAGASATVNLTRGLPAAGGVACVEYLRDALTPGYFSLVLAALVVLGMLPAYLHQTYGQKWRAQRMESTKGERSRKGSLLRLVEASLRKF